MHKHLQLCVDIHPSTKNTENKSLDNILKKLVYNSVYTLFENEKTRKNYV